MGRGGGRLIADNGQLRQQYLSSPPGRTNTIGPVLKTIGADSASVVAIPALTIERPRVSSED